MQIEEELSNRQKLILEAVRKMDQAQKLFTEGKLEFEHLTKESTNSKGGKTTAGGRDVTKAVEKLKPKKAKKVLANKLVRAAKKRGKIVAIATNTKLTKRILAVIRKSEFMNVTALMSKLKSSFYPVKRVVDALIKDNQLRYILKAHPKTHAVHSYLSLT